MSEHGHEEPGRDELLEEQETKGYGEDEGERDDALETDGDEQ